MYSAKYSSIYSYSPTALLPTASGYSDYSFWDYDLQNGSVNIVAIDLESPGSIQYISKDRWLSDGATYIDSKTRLRPIVVRGYLIAATKQAVEELADTFKQNISETQAYFRFKTRGSTYRQILATATSVDMARASYEVTKIPFKITFTANDPFFQLVGGLSDNFVGITSPTLIDQVANIGSANMAVKAYLLFGVWNSGVTTISFTANGRTLTIAQAVSNSDVFLLDMDAKAIYYNGTRHDYTGTFPDFLPGNNDITVAVNGTHLYDLVVLKTIKYR